MVAARFCLSARSAAVLSVAIVCGNALRAQQTARLASVNLPDAPTPSSGTWSGASPASTFSTSLAITAEEDVPTQSKEPVTLRGLPRRFLQDELHIITSPARIHTQDLKWLLPLAGATGVALGTDTYTMRNVVSRNPAFNDANNTSSDVLRGFAIGVPVVLFGAGHITHNEHTRETGLLAGEAMIDAYAFDAAVKYVMLRERPSQNDARGHFFVGDAASDPSFISGHSVVAWSSAAVLAAEYNRPWQQIGIYTLASGVSLNRVLGQQHFPTDVLLGSAAGWLVGHYVYRAHHRTAKR